MILGMPSLLKLIADELVSELRTISFGNEPSFVIDVYFEAKTSFKGLAFSLKSAASLSPTFIGGINGIFNHLRKFSI